MATPPTEPGPWSFPDIYGELQPKIRRYLGRLVGRSEAEDLTQEVFVRVSRALPDFRGDSSVSTWVYRIATNVAFDALRSPALHRTHPLLVQIGRPVIGRGPNVEQELVRQEMNACIRRYVDDLPTSYRSVVLLSEEEGLADREIAHALGISLATVKIRLHRARRHLRKGLGDGCRLYRDERNELACEPKPGAVSSRD
jgi:RNA polymerase sigma-70 factor (ECF subfamily)